MGTASQTSVAAAGLCSVSYDGFTLPLIAPAGRWMAVQTGVAPEWPALLGTKDARIPVASSLEVWSLAERTGTRVATLEKGLILGRSADQEGFLVEEILDDGSRRIGYVRWPDVAMAPATPTAPPTLQPEWLIDDGRVNAFACLGPDGTIAWSARDITNSDFSLSVRSATSAFEVPAAPDQSWLLPVFARDSRTIFAIRLRDGIADLVAADITDEDAFHQSLIVRRLSVRMDSRRAYQAMAPQGTDSAVGPGEDARLVIFDPDLRRMAVWDPANDSLRPLAERSFAACIAADGSVLVSDGEGVFLDHPDGQPGRAPLVYERVAVPRRVQFEGDAPGDWILLVPDRRSISVVRFALLQATLTSR
ncbi:MAG: hypothetical protein SGJ11_08880 [Phycisphaerae bacterium]|nr:hypothetical protein [Phycisphaerae bacterium]